MAAGACRGRRASALASGLAGAPLELPALGEGPALAVDRRPLAELVEVFCDLVASGDLEAIDATDAPSSACAVTRATPPSC